MSPHRARDRAEPVNEPSQASDRAEPTRSKLSQTVLFANGDSARGSDPIRRWWRSIWHDPEKKTATAHSLEERGGRRLVHGAIAHNDSGDASDDVAVRCITTWRRRDAEKIVVGDAIQKNMEICMQRRASGNRRSFVRKRRERFADTEVQRKIVGRDEALISGSVYHVRNNTLLI
jgi:hypothetical protein